MTLISGALSPLRECSSQRELGVSSPKNVPDVWSKVLLAVRVYPGMRRPAQTTVNKEYTWRLRVRYAPTTGCAQYIPQEYVTLKLLGTPSTSELDVAKLLGSPLYLTVVHYA